MRMSPEERSKMIIDAATELAEKNGLYQFSLIDVGQRLKCAPSLVSYHFGTIEKLRERVILNAISDNVVNSPVLAQALVRRDPLVQYLSARIKRNVLETYM